MGVKDHADSRCTNRVAATDETTTGIDRYPPADLKVTSGDRLTLASRWSDAEVVDGEVLRWCEAVMRLDAVDLVHAGHPSPGEGIEDCAAHMRQDVLIVGRTFEFPGKWKRHCAVTPAHDARARVCVQLRVRSQEGIVHQHQRCCPIGDLRAVPTP